MLQTCHSAASNRWANFVAVDFYKRSEEGGVFQATDMLNGRLLCGCDDVHVVFLDLPPLEHVLLPKKKVKQLQRMEEGHL
ncbi:PI-PLC X domain-containing protein At5g67130-like [Phalaenopsis equestris]|uniref:PI-PLC X domain-containing protein At5g67130-like n=1 Tax=Phalaenopsis equestris TaxID=78828 RepID=UPI0009E3BACA|nr:PI-PLC X domain-containing protein At5g67130-like [Phalaenopsis equestris]